MILNPNADGLTHINVYSKGKTWLGRTLSNFAYCPIETIDGHFDSIEGYWYWLSCKDDVLRFLSGWRAKQYGRNAGGKDWIDSDDFKYKIKAAIDIKLLSIDGLLNELQNCHLPLKHYYVFNGKVKIVSQSNWIIGHLESYKKG